MTTPAGPVRFCPACKQADTSPRHAIYGDDPNVALHMDCCRAQGCPDGSCNVIAAVVGEDKKDDALRAAIQKQNDKIATKMDERDDETRHFTVGQTATTLGGAQ